MSEYIVLVRHNGEYRVQVGSEDTDSISSVPVTSGSGELLMLRYTGYPNGTFYIEQGSGRPVDDRHARYMFKDIVRQMMGWKV